MAIQKREYELSVWNEELIDGVKTETRGIIIGAHDMTHLGRATNVKLKSELKGTNTLTFQMPTKYFDSEKGEFVKNELIEDLYNERKVKLYYKDQWKEFYVKKITEEKQFKAIMKTFECTDSFIEELSRTGYEIEFASDLNNSVEEIGVFTEEILEDSIWDYRPDMNIGDFTEYSEERFYKIPLSQFGGSITAYPIDLEVYSNELKNDVEGKTKEERVIMTNPYTYEQRPLEYGDDQARVEELFWDAYKNDNGRDLLNDENLVTLTGDYIYVPITDLSFIMGSIYKTASTSLENPAIYGQYDAAAATTKYALQPTSENPQDLIEFIFFNQGDNVYVDDQGVVANNDCHYVITIEQWSNAIKKQLEKTLEDNEGVIYWILPYEDEYDNLTSIYSTSKVTVDNEGYIYTTGVRPSTKTVDEFNWWPVYYEGYLNEIADEEVSMARNISVTDRTELNLNQDIYVTVYKNDDISFANDNLYSEEELQNLILEREKLRKKTNLTNDEKTRLSQIDNDFRVCSKLNTRLIVPSLAQNLIENGTEITDTNGWEAQTQNINHELFDTGSYRKMLEVNIQQTVKNSNSDESLILSEAELTGGTDDEGITDYYLELLSPCYDKGDNLAIEGETLSDYAINFGLTGSEKKIEKDKVYAIRLTTGTWYTTDYNFILRATDTTVTENNESASYTKSQKEDYEEVFDTYRKIIIHLDPTDTPDFNDYPDGYQSIWNSFKKLCESYSSKTSLEDSDETTINNTLYSILKSISELKIGTEPYQIFSNIVKYNSSATSIEDRNDTDLIYLKYQFLAQMGDLIDERNSATSSSFYYATYLSDSIVSDWKGSYIIENAIFEKKNNVDLDKVIIGEGSTNLQGNYVISTDNCINFSDYLSDLEKTTGLYFLPSGEKAGENQLTNPLYYSRLKDLSNEENINKRWSWFTADEVETSSHIAKYYDVEDNAYLLFKAPITIENPYVGIKVESGPAEIKFDSIEQVTYTKNSGLGIKICAAASKETKATLSSLLIDQYNYIEGAQVQVYAVNSTNFSDDFLNMVHYDKDSSSSGYGTVTINSSDKEWNLEEGDLKTSTPNWTSETSLTEPTYYSYIKMLDTSSKKTFAYALFVDDVYYGIFWLEKK